MSWIKIDDNAMDHPKILALSDGAFRLWMRGLAYCRRHLTDGLISHLALKTFRESKPSRVTELTGSPCPGVAPLWEACEDGYGVHDYLQWNDTREHVETARSQARERMSKLRGSSQSVRSNFARSSQSVRDTSTSSTPAPAPAPAQEGENAPTALRPVHPAQRHGLPTLHRRGHQSHAFCSERICVPDFQHDKFVRALGGVNADERLRTFYSDTVGSIPDSQGIESDPLKFWPPYVTARWPPADAQVGTRTAALQRATAEFLRGAK